MDLSDARRIIESAASESARSGELVIDLPGDSIRLPDGALIRLPAQWIHPAVGDLDTIKWRFLDLAKGMKHPSVLASGHILAALAKALKLRDTATLSWLHRWA